LKTVTRFVLAFGCILYAAASVAAPAAADQRLSDLVESYFEEYLALNPVLPL
jgi:hypothetical protein